MTEETNLEYRNLTLTSPQVNTKAESDYEVYGYATTFEPYVLMIKDGIEIFEKIERTAFQNTEMSDVIMQYNHEGRVLARQSNGSLKISVDERGLFISANLGGSTVARELYSDIKAGLINKMSWAFVVDHQVFDKASRTRIVKSIKKVYEVGAVSIPANDNTLIGARSAATDDLIKAERIRSANRRRQILKMKVAIDLMANE